MDFKLPFDKSIESWDEIYKIFCKNYDVEHKHDFEIIKIETHIEQFKGIYKIDWWSRLKLKQIQK